MHLQVCQLCICDVNDSGTVSAPDALFCLKDTVGQDVTLDCPPCATTTTTLVTTTTVPATTTTLPPTTTTSTIPPTTSTTLPTECKYCGEVLGLQGLAGDPAQVCENERAKYEAVVACVCEDHCSQQCAAQCASHVAYTGPCAACQEACNDQIALCFAPPEQ